MTTVELNQLAEQGFITDVTLIEACTKNPELLKTIDFGQFVSQITSPMDAEEVNEETTEPEVGEETTEPEVGEETTEPEVNEETTEPEVIEVSQVLNQPEQEIVVEEQE